MPKTKTTGEFIKDAINIHKYKYDYSKADYIGNKNKIKILCKEHGVFEQRPNDHLSGRGCKACGINNMKKIRNKSKEFIKKAEHIHNNKYDYSKVEYVNNKTKVKIICLIHGEFEQNPKQHIIRKDGCSKCSNKNKKNIDIFKEDACKIHNNKYDYSLIEYKNAHTKTKIVCPKHNMFEMSYNKHITKEQGCPKCSSSKGENRVRNCLEENNIKFEEQKIFNDLKYKSYLRFDFYLPEQNLLIEYDGIQHYKIVEHFGGRRAFMKLKHRDKLKNEYCVENNINLLRIPYTEYNNIENMLKIC